jgi:hypothetical protein
VIAKPKKLKSDDSFFNFYEPLQTSAADILIMLIDRANGGRSQVLVFLNNFN